MKRRAKLKDIRRGPLSKEEKSKIEVLQESKTDEEIATLLRRALKQVVTYKNEFLARAPAAIVQKTEKEEFRRELHAAMDWQRFQSEFTPEELLFFENDYVNYRAQLKEITASERKQLYHLITLDIHMHRHNANRMKVQEDIARLERLIRRLYDLPVDQQNPEQISALELQLSAARSATNSQTREYKDLLDKHQAIQRDLKTTRDQRIKNLEDRGKFIIILKEMEMEDVRHNIGEEIGLMDLAIQKEKERLSAFHKYADGILDRPLLTPETVSDASEEAGSISIR